MFKIRLNDVKTSLCTLLLISLCSASHAADGKKYALVVGVERYDPSQLTSLQYAEDDAIAMGQALQKLGFDVIVMTRQSDVPDRVPSFANDILTQLKRRIRDRSPDDTVVVALSGHGVQLKGDKAGSDGTKETYFCPERADLRSTSTLLAMSTVVDEMKQCKAGRKLLLVDACRNEVEPKDIVGKDASPVEIELDPAGVTRRTIPNGMVALFSCSPRERSFEISNLSHSVFTYHVLQYLDGKADSNRYPKQQISISELAAYVSRETRDYIDGRLSKDQNPELLLPSGRLIDWSLGEINSLPDLITNSIGMKLTLIPAGEFLMGSSDADVAAALKADSSLTEEYLKREQPQHRVKISRPFYAGVYEVTQGEYEAVMGVNPSYISSSGSDKVGGQNTKRFPVETVTWYDAVEFCNKLSERDNLQPYYSLTSVERENGRIKSATVTPASGGRQSPDTSGYRLPTEAEWEYMCRAGTTSAYNFGNVLNGDKANVDGNYPFGTTTKGSYLERPTTVGSYGANKFGLYDVHGNVYEWCFDVYDESAYGSRRGTTEDPLSSGGSEYRVLRGGSWGSHSWNARSAYRLRYLPGLRNSHDGFRVVR